MRHDRAPTRIALAILAAATIASGRTAHGDGAFPDSLGILLPSDLSHRIIAATNFGLLLSDDDGNTWKWICEQAIGSYVTIYQIGPPPDDRLFAVSADGLHLSSDGACSWNSASGPYTYVSDVFPDPSDPTRVLAIANVASADAGLSKEAVLESKDGGRTFNFPIFVPSADVNLTGIEVAAGDPKTLYAAGNSYEPQVHPYLFRSTNGGANWQTIDIGSIGALSVRILAVDPANAQRVYLRLQGVNGQDQLGIYDETTGGLSVPLQLDYPMSAFLRRSNGDLIVGTRDNGAFISTDNGSSFLPWPNAPHLRALGERDGILYAVGDNQQDKFVVGVSNDNGRSWRPLIRFDQIGGVLSCGSVPSTCAGAWENLKTTFGIGPGGRDASGCGCTLNGRAGSGWLGILTVALAVIRWRTRSRSAPRE